MCETTSVDATCPGTGRCHGCLRWCDECGSVRHVCDMRLRGERCDQHPVPPPMHKLRQQRYAQQRIIAKARADIRAAEHELIGIEDQTQAARAFLAQLAKEEKCLFSGTGTAETGVRPRGQS